MTTPPGDHLLFRYLEGTCTKEEQKWVERWLMEDPSHADRFERFVAEHSEPVAIDQDALSEKLFRNIEQIPDEIAAAPSSEKRFSYPTRFQKRTGTPWMAAAAVLLVTFASAAFVHLLMMNAPEAQEPVFVERTVPAGNTSTITLSDGSNVRLNAESTLRFPEYFSSDSAVREVFLEGEAFFDVTGNEDAPFIVHAGQLEITVLGTAFTIKAYPGEEVTQVAVADGKVSVKREHADVSSVPVVLEPNQWVTYNHNSQILEKEQGSIRELIAWKDGILFFHDKSVAEVTEMLERWYNTTIVIEEEAVKNCLIHGEHKDESLEHVLKMMQFTLDINYAFTEEGVILSGGRCQ